MKRGEMRELALKSAEGQKEAAKKALEARLEVEGLRSDLKKREAALMDEIANALGPDQKSLYSNAEKRSSELARRKDADPDLKKVEELIRNKSRLSDEGQIDAHYQQNLVNIYVVFGSVAPATAE